MGVPLPRQPPDPIRRLLHRHDCGDHDPGADLASDRLDARHRPDPFWVDHHPQPDDRAPAPAAWDGAVRARPGSTALGRAHHHGDPALAGAAPPGPHRDHLHPSADALATSDNGSYAMTVTALAATLFAAQDLRVTEVRLRFPSGICGSTLHHYLQ